MQPVRTSAAWVHRSDDPRSPSEGSHPNAARSLESPRHAFTTTRTSPHIPRDEILRPPKSRSRSRGGGFPRGGSGRMGSVARVLPRRAARDCSRARAEGMQPRTAQPEGARLADKRPRGERARGEEAGGEEAGGEEAGGEEAGGEGFASAAPFRPETKTRAVPARATHRDLGWPSRDSCTAWRRSWSPRLPFQPSSQPLPSVHPSVRNRCQRERRPCYRDPPRRKRGRRRRRESGQRSAYEETSEGIPTSRFRRGRVFGRTIRTKCQSEPRETCRNR